jgi:hypothetical protein
MLHTKRILSSLTWPFQLQVYLAKSTSNCIPRYAVFSSILSLHLLSPNILLSQHSQTPSVHVSPLNVRDQVSHQYKSTAKTIVMYNIILALLGNRREGRSFWTKLQRAFSEFSLLLNSFWIKYWFETTISKYLNCATSCNSSVGINV